MAETTFFAFLNLLDTQLGAHLAGTVDFADVDVVPVETDETPLETVILVRPTPAGATVDVAQTWAALGAGRRDDEYTVPMRVTVRRNGFESATAFYAAGARAESIAAEVIGWLRDNTPQVGDQTLRSMVSDVSWTIGTDGSGWLVVGDFDLDVRVRVS